jgi:AcrR family transcriptional regulator
MAAALDVSINRLVHHFGSKEELLTAALARSLEQAARGADATGCRESPRLTQAELYRKWWRWMNAARPTSRWCA